MPNEETTNYSIGTNVVVKSCTNDLNELLKISNPFSINMPWNYWYDIMQSGNFIITCFDDEKNRVIGMVMVTSIIKPVIDFVIYNIAVLDAYADNPHIKSSLLISANELINKLKN